VLGEGAKQAAVAEHRDQGIETIQADGVRQALYK
jgi:hypothetical protein